MRWNWDFLRNKRIEIDNRFRSTRPAGKMITINGHEHEIQGAHLSDMDVAGRIRMLMRGQLDHESVCTLARDRVVYLADRLGEIEAITADDIGRAIYAVELRWLAPSFPDGHVFLTFDELDDRDRRLHSDYGKAVLALITGTPVTSTDGAA